MGHYMQAIDSFLTFAENRLVHGDVSLEKLLEVFAVNVTKFYSDRKESEIH